MSEFWIKWEVLYKYKTPTTSVINIYTNAIVFYLVQYAFELFRIIVEIDKQAVFNITVLLLEIKKKIHEFKILQFLADILIGMPSTSPGDLQSKIQDEHMKHLVAELDIKVL